MHVRAVRVLGIVGLLLLTGCSDGGADSADPTVPTAVSTSPTTSAVDVATIPAQIDANYLNQVLATLDEVEGQATRVIVANKDLVPEAAEILNSIYSDDRFRAQADAWLTTLDNDPELSSIRPGNRKTTVERMITATPACVWMAVQRDYSATTAEPQAPRTEYVSLRPLDKSNDPRARNPTAWMITVDGFNEDGSEPGNQCAN